MLVDLKARLDEPEVKLLFAAAMFADDNEVQTRLDRYKKEEQLQAWGIESEGDLIAVIGYQRVQDNTLEILHIAVSPDERGHGYGRGIILETIEREKPEVVIAETDEDAVDFYRNIGFMIESLGEKYPGVERFMCTFVTDF
jgi:ribosomal protein S18 acetylase RimI-like enzyme